MVESSLELMLKDLQVNILKELESYWEGFLTDNIRQLILNQHLKNFSVGVIGQDISVYAVILSGNFSSLWCFYCVLLHRTSPTA